MREQNRPCLNAGIWISFPVITDISLLKKTFPKETEFRFYEDCIEASVVEVKDFYDWEVTAVLTQLFSLCDLDAIKQISLKFGGKIHIGIWYYSYGVNPAIIFEGENMEIIHKLNADLSIDPY